MISPAAREGRLGTLDLLRGLTIVSMIFYHGMWDYLYLTQAGRGAAAMRAWYEGPSGHLWQQSICCTFILLSGFCAPFSHRIIRRGLQVSAGGAAVSAVTFLFMYEERVVFGVLTFLGAAMLAQGLLFRFCARRTCFGRLLCALPGPAGVFLSLALFACFRQVNRGYLCFLPGLRLRLPAALYVQKGAAGLLLTAAGFPMKGFFSTDYFSFLPWFFLFQAGVCLHGFIKEKKWFSHPLSGLRLPVLNRMGRHSLLIYLAHQPVLYLFASILWK